MRGLQTVFMILVHSLFLTVKVNHGALQDIYIGCYRAFGNQNGNLSAVLPLVPLPSNEITAEKCIDACRKHNHTYAAVQRDSCFCGDEFEGQLADKNCQAECSGSKSQLCGGSDEKSYSIYSVCPTGNYGPLCDKVCHCQLRAVCNRTTGLCPNGCDRSWQGRACDEPNISIDKTEWYIGCYNDDNPNALDVKNPGMKTGSRTTTNTIPFCREICANFNYTYLGTQYSYDCNCGDSYDRYGQGNRCDFPCSNNRSQVCGGNYANSVYSVCPIGSYAQNCLSSCNCLNNSRCVYRNGSCSNGCKSGWSGSSCSIRDCQETNGDCSGVHEICETVDLRYATITRCGCGKGYGRKRPWEVCSDIDECSDRFSACGADAYNCTNTDGGFWCSYCPEGLHNVNGTCVSTPTDMSSAVGVIVGAVFGAVFALLVITLIILFILRYRHKFHINNNRDGAGSLDNSTAVLGKDTDEINSGRKRSKAGLNYYDEAETQYENVAPITTRVKIDELAAVFRTLCETHGALDKEFKSVPMDCKAVSNYGKKKDLKPKNRFKNIIPYDHNRVILSTIANQNYSDYINASFISVGLSVSLIKW